MEILDLFLQRLSSCFGFRLAKQRSLATFPSFNETLIFLYRITFTAIMEAMKLWIRSTTHIPVKTYHMKNFIDLPMMISL